MKNYSKKGIDSISASKVEDNTGTLFEIVAGVALFASMAAVILLWMVALTPTV